MEPGLTRIIAVIVTATDCHALVQSRSTTKTLHSLKTRNFGKVFDYFVKHANVFDLNGTGTYTYHRCDCHCNRLPRTCPITIYDENIAQFENTEFWQSIRLFCETRKCVR